MAVKKRRATLVVEELETELAEVAAAATTAKEAEAGLALDAMVEKTEEEATAIVAEATGSIQAAIAKCAGAKVTISAKMTALTQDDIPARTALQKESEKLTQAEVKLKHLTTVCKEIIE